MFGNSYRDDFPSDTITGDEAYGRDISLDTDSDKFAEQLTYAEGSGSSHGVVCRNRRRLKLEMILYGGRTLVRNIPRLHGTEAVELYRHLYAS